MSRAAVRTAFRTALSTWATANSVEVVDSINDATLPSTDSWCTVEFTADFAEPTAFLKSRHVDSGTVDVTVYGLAGEGDGTVNALADSCEDYFRNLGALDTGLDVVDTVAATETGAGDAAGRYYGLTVSLEYLHFRP